MFCLFLFYIVYKEKMFSIKLKMGAKHAKKPSSLKCKSFPTVFNILFNN